jgi:hypothetical protein
MNIIESQGFTPVATLNITSMVNNYTYHFCIGYDSAINQMGYQLKQGNVALLLSTINQPVSTATIMTVTISYFD